MLYNLQANYKNFWNRENIKSFAFGLLLLVLAMILQKFADNYVAGITGTAVGDIILDWLPTIDVDTWIIIGTLLFTVLAVLRGLYEPKSLSFSLKALALFITVRSVSITLTHLGPHPNILTFDNTAPLFQIYDVLYNTKGDFFFSGHTGVPFLLALVYWQDRLWRYIYLLTSVFFASLVLLSHIHYSIDVFAAPFITFSIFILAKYIFKKG